MFAKKEDGSGPILFINTFNSVDLGELAESVKPADLPGEIRRLFD